MNQSDTVDRFSTKADLYSRYRWAYAPEAIDAIFQITQLSGEASVADIGAGTGMVSRQLADRVKQVFAIEPNLAMRQLAEQALAQYPSVVTIHGYADATTLPNQSVDLITVGRAIHWFNAATTPQEFRRILKPQGWLAILQIPCTDDAFNDAFDKFRSTAEDGWATNRDQKRRNKPPLSIYYGHSDFSVFQFPEVRQETWHEFLNRITSLSPAPDPTSPVYNKFEKAMRDLFDQFSDGDRISLNICTELTLGVLQ